ncbi:OsmC family protein [bacterium]|nr:OsmC family protein [bacterium]
MDHYTATVAWSRRGAVFADGRYSRAHTWRLDGGIEVPASSSTHIVPPPMSIESAIDPEEAFVASLSSCHMLWFLHLAQKAGLVVEHYEDTAAGRMGRNSEGRLAMIEVVLRPRAVFFGEAPSGVALTDLHERAHAECFIANSVKTDVRVEPLPGGGI